MKILWEKKWSKWKQQVKKGMVFVSIMSFAFVSLAGCGKKNDSSSETSNSDTKTITIGSGTNYKPYAYLDESGEAVGYEYDVLAEIDKILPQYEFKYESMNFDNILLSLDAGKVDVAAHQYEYTDERAEKYLFSEEFYSEFVTYIGVLSHNNDINSLEDLAGKKVNAGGTTSATYTILTNWNEEHPGKEIELVSTENTSDETTATNLRKGIWDATILEEKDVDKMNKEYAAGKEEFKIVGEPVNESHGYYLFAKDDTELQKAFDGAIKELKENGKLEELANKWLSDLTNE